jgi:hypothetical protein
VQGLRVGFCVREMGWGGREREPICALLAKNKTQKAAPSIPVAVSCFHFMSLCVCMFVCVCVCEREREREREREQRHCSRFRV